MLNVFIFFKLFSSFKFIFCQILNILRFKIIIFIINSFLSIYESLMLIYLNIFIYLLLLITVFLIFFLFDTRILKTLNQFKLIVNWVFLSVNLVVLFLSLAGLPPLFGFFGKFLFLSFFLQTNSLFFIIFVFFINLFVIFFYIQNTRFMLQKTQTFYFFFKRNYPFISFKLLVLLNVLCLINMVSIFVVDDINLFFFFLTSPLNLF